MLTVSRASLWLAGTASLLFATACSAPTITGFTITAGPSPVNIAPGGTSYLTVAATTTNTSPVTVAVVLFNLPTGVSSSPAAPTVTSGSQTTIALTAAANAPAVTNQVQVTGYTGLAASNAYVNVTVYPAAP
jgi:hypothetical protein